MGDTETAVLPPGWAWAPLGDLITGIEAGLNVAAIGRAPVAGETGIVKISAVTWGEFDEEQSKTLPATMPIDPRHLIAAGDFLISRANTLELVGAPVIVKKIERRLVLSDKVLRLRFRHGLDRWVELYLKSPAGRVQIESRAQGAQLSMRNISQDKLRKILVPLAPDAERKRILDITNESLSDVDEAEAALNRALHPLKAEVGQLRRSILHAAFAGRLVPQDPADEPAAALLARFCAEAAPPALRRRAARTEVPRP